MVHYFTAIIAYIWLPWSYVLLLLILQRLQSLISLYVSLCSVPVAINIPETHPHPHPYSFLPSFLPYHPPPSHTHSLTLDTTIYHGISSIFISGVCLCWIPCFVAPRSVKRDYTTIMLPPGVPAIYQGTIHNDVHRHTITRRARSTIRLSCPLWRRWLIVADYYYSARRALPFIPSANINMRTQTIQQRTPRITSFSCSSADYAWAKAQIKQIDVST